MKASLEKLKVEFNEFFLAHEQVKSFHWGDLLDFYASNQVRHSTVVIQPIRLSEISRTKVTVQLLVTVADRVATRKFNLDEVHSDSVLILSDLVDTMNVSQRWRSFITGATSGDAQLFENRTGDLVAGAVMTINVTVTNISDLCAIPLDDYDFDQDFKEFCRPATLIVNGERVTDISSGFTFELKVKDTTGDEVGQLISGEWIVEASGGNATVENSDQTFQENVAVGDTLVLEDYDFEFQDADGNILDNEIRPAMIGETFIVGAGGVCSTEFDYDLYVNGEFYETITININEDINITT